MSKMKHCIIFIAVFVFVQGKDVDLPFLHPCKLQDFECYRQLWQNAVPYLAKGIPELQMAPLDPMKLNNIKISVPNLLEVNFIKGVMKGYRTCVVESYKWTYLRKVNVGAEIDLKCNIVIKGQYNATALTDIIPGLTVDGILKADGDVKLNLPNLHLKFILDLDVVRNDADDIILLLKTPINYKYQATEPVIFKANNILFDGQDISPLVVNLMNVGWRYLIDSFGGAFFDEAMKRIGDVQKMFFDGVPCSKYIDHNMEEFL